MFDTLIPYFFAHLFVWVISPFELEVLVNLVFVVPVSILRHPINTKAHQLILFFNMIMPQIKVTLQ